MSRFPWADLPGALREAGLTVVEEPGWLGRGPDGAVRDVRQFEGFGRDPYAPASIADLVAFLVVVPRLAGGDRPRFGHHRQHTSRKPDMSYTGDLWTPVRRRLAGIADPPKP